MKRFFKEGCGYHIFNYNIEQAEADGWVEVSDAQWKEILTKKGSKTSSPIANIPDNATIEAQPVRKAGRPRKEMVQPY